MENTEQTATTEEVPETNEPGKKAPSPRKEEANGKIGPGGYNRSVELIRHDLDRFEKEHHKLRDELRETLSVVKQVLPQSAPGDLTSFVDRGLSDPGLSKTLPPDRNEIARTWEEGKRTVEELDAFYSRLRTQKIWSQEDLEGILTRFESLAQGIADSVQIQQKIMEGLESSSAGRDPDPRESLALAALSTTLSSLGERIAESRQAILEAIADRSSSPGTDRSPSFDSSVLLPLLHKIGDLEELVKQTRGTPPLDAAPSTRSPGFMGRGIRNSFFAKTETDAPKSAGKPAGPQRVRRLGVLGLMAALAIVAIIARIKHSGPPPEMTKPVANRETIRPLLAPPPPSQNFESVLPELDRLREGESKNGQAIADLSEKIDRVLTKLPKGAVLTAQEKRGIEEGRELEWLVKTWPAGPGRKELLRMMGNYAGE